MNSLFFFLLFLVYKIEQVYIHLSLIKNVKHEKAKDRPLIKP